MTAAGALFPGERRIVAGGVPMVAHVRTGEPGKPLVLFLTGGGVLARVAYGHPGADPHDFLDHWLERAGWGLLAPSYPSDHPVSGAARPDLGLAEWAEALAALVAEETAPSQPVVPCGWSMGGKLVFALTRALRAHGRAPDCFVSLCATPPFPRLGSGTPAERLLADGHWDITHGRRDGKTRDERWRDELAVVAAVEGHDVLGPVAFRSHYRANTPPALWGPEINPYFEGETPRDLAGALREAGAFSGADYPICAAIVPVDARDFRHALADEAVWGAVTVQALLHNHLNGRIPLLSRADWIAVRELVTGAPQRLARQVPGGHFFFLGLSGARRTAAHIEALHGEVKRLETLLAET